MKHIFDVELATEIGINAAIILENLLFWCKKNKANNKHCYDGSTWTYNSVEAFSELFPYMSKFSIRKALEDLEKLGYITTGNFNKAAYDRTKWYSVLEKGVNAIDKCIYRKQEMHLSKTENGFIENQKPIPYINPDINLIKKNIGNVPAEQLPSSENKDTSNKNSKEQIIQKKAERILSRFNILRNEFRQKNNLKKSSGFSPTPAHLKEIIARLKKGRTYKECIQILENKIQDEEFVLKDWYVPETLFREAKFQKYLDYDPKQYEKKQPGVANGSGISGNIDYSLRPGRDKKIKVDKTNWGKYDNE